jgi:hypothetical protein
VKIKYTHYTSFTYFTHLATVYKKAMLNITISRVYLGSQASILPAVVPTQISWCSGLIEIQFIAEASVSTEARNRP